MTLILEDGVIVEVVIPPTLVVEVDLPPIPSVRVLYPEPITLTIENPIVPSIYVPVLPGARGQQGIQGIPGTPGTPGEAMGSYIHIQSAPTAIWNIYHNLSFIPNIMVVDSSGTRVFGNEEIISTGHVRITFSGPFSGTAYLS